MDESEDKEAAAGEGGNEAAEEGRCRDEIDEERP